jgi:type I restriction enzyme R subunit
LADLIHQVVESVKRNLKVDWTKPHRESVKAGVRAAVRRVLRRNKVQAEDLERFVELILEQAEALYEDWPRAA